MSLERTKKSFSLFMKYAIGVMLSPFRIFKALCFFIGFAVLMTLFASGFYVYSFMDDVNQISKYSFEKLKKISLTKTAEKFQNKSKFNSGYKWVPISEIHKQLSYSFVLSEDATFFQHEGVNYNAMIDSLALNIRKREYAAGASTITQQVVKNIFLTSEKSIDRKIKEIFMAKELEDTFSKNQILELYLNIAELGSDIFGVEMASQHYFGRSSSEINALEGTFMALMLPSPKRYYLSIYQNRFISANKRKKMSRILGDMYNMEYISPDQYRSYIEDDVLNHLKQ